jgi:hypothetical protein
VVSCLRLRKALGPPGHFIIGQPASIDAEVNVATEGVAGVGYHASEAALVPAIQRGTGAGRRASRKSGWCRKASDPGLVGGRWCPNGIEIWETTGIRKKSTFRSATVPVSLLPVSLLIPEPAGCTAFSHPDGLVSTSSYLFSPPPPSFSGLSCSPAAAAPIASFHLSPGSGTCG